MWTWKKEHLRDLINFSDKIVEKAVMTIYQYQTKEEQGYDTTIDSNGVGFNAVDAEILSSFARQLFDGKHLSNKQIMLARKKMTKYAGQLTYLANQKERANHENNQGTV